MKNKSISNLTITLSIVFDPHGSLGNRSRNQTPKTVPCGEDGLTRTFFSPQCLKASFRSSEDYIRHLEHYGSSRVMQSNRANTDKHACEVLHTLLRNHIDGINVLDVSEENTALLAADGYNTVVTNTLNIFSQCLTGGKASKNDKNRKTISKANAEATEESTEEETTARGAQVFKLSDSEIQKMLTAILKGNDASTSIKTLTPGEYDTLICGRFLTSQSTDFNMSVPACLNFSGAIGLLKQQSATHGWTARDELATESHGAINLQEETIVNGWHQYDVNIRVGELQDSVSDLSDRIKDLTQILMRHIPRHGRAKGEPEIIGVIASACYAQPLSSFNVAKAALHEGIDAETFMQQYHQRMTDRANKLSLYPGENKVLGYVSMIGESENIQGLSDQIKAEIDSCER